MFNVCERPDIFGNDFSKVPICLRHSEWPVYFLLSQRGEALEVHIAADGREGKKAMRTVGAEFLKYIDIAYPWCKMLIAPVTVKSVYNFCIKMGFNDLGVGNFGDTKANVMVVNYERCN